MGYMALRYLQALDDDAAPLHNSVHALQQSRARLQHALPLVFAQRHTLLPRSSRWPD